MRLSQRIQAISPSPTVAMDNRTKQLIAAGHDVVNLSVGEPDFDTPAPIKAAAIKAIEAGFTKYGANPGNPDLRQAICAKLQADNGLDYTPEQIIVSNGAKQSVHNAYMALLDPGDEVILQAPYWVTYPEAIRLAEGVPVVIETDESTGFRMTAAMIAARLTPRTRVINLNSPSNPTGAIYTARELKEIAELAVAHDLYVVSDEIYEKLLYDGAEHVSIASFGPEIKERTVVINGLSKSHAMTGWRIGYTASAAPLAKAMNSLQSHTTSGANNIAQKAAVAALTGDQSAVQAMVVEFDRRRRYVLERLSAIDGISCARPAGAFYVFPNVAGLLGRTIGGRRIDTVDDLGQLILDAAQVAVVPGSGFGAPHYLRLSYATSLERLQEALDRIEALLRS